MNLLITFIACIITHIITRALLHWRSRYGDMDVKWNEEDGVWDANLHFPAAIDYSKVKQVIIKVNHK